MSIVVENQRIGMVTSYAYAVSQGYEGTEEEYAELMASYATVAQTAVDAKDTAVEAKNTAVSAKNDAVSAKNAAETAKSNAVDAKNAAVTAQNNASSYKDAANTAKQAAQTAQGVAQANSLISEGYAVGKQNGSTVVSGTYYHYNAKYFAEQAARSASTLVIDDTLSYAGRSADAKKTGDEITDLKSRIPKAPSSNGTYKLQCVVSGGVPTYSWVLE